MFKVRKLIETQQENEVVCDNVNCDFVVKNVNRTLTDCKRFLNVACPKCGQNLLTQADYDQWVILYKYINFMNKWFSWITFFMAEPNGNGTKMQAYVHKGVKITEI